MSYKWFHLSFLPLHKCRSSGLQIKNLDTLVVSSYKLGAYSSNGVLKLPVKASVAPLRLHLNEARKRSTVNATSITRPFSYRTKGCLTKLIYYERLACPNTLVVVLPQSVKFLSRATKATVNRIHVGSRVLSLRFACLLVVCARVCVCTD